jgi:hypothetical protein
MIVYHLLLARQVLKLKKERERKRESLMHLKLGASFFKQEENDAQIDGVLSDITD